MEKPVSRSGCTDLPFRLVRAQVDLLEVAGRQSRRQPVREERHEP
jgi:hypothetical protein